MGRLENAEGRLDRAVARLEEAAQRPDLGATPSPGMEQELMATRQRCETLESRSQEVSERLDATIAQLYAILDNDHGPG